MSGPCGTPQNEREHVAEQIVALCAAGSISVPVALARLVFAGFTPPEIAARLPEGSELSRLFDAQRERLSTLADMLNASGARHGALAGTPEEMVQSTAAMFDRAVALQPEASVAAYSLGDEALLAAATDELVLWLTSQGLVHSNCDVLDLGCGIGRVSNGLAGQVRSVLGLDVSPGMIIEARRRSQAANLRFEVTDGRPPTHLPPGGFDLILFVDSMPYLVQAGIADAHVEVALQLLRGGGALAIFNLSYRNDPASDAADARRWADHAGGQLTHCGVSPFTLWDGAAFIIRTGKDASLPCGN